MKYRNYSANRALPLVAFAAMAFATSCSNDSLADGGKQSSATGEGQAVELTASLNEEKDAATRVGMTKEEGNKASFFWHKDEAILVQTKNGESYSGVKFTTTAATGAATATFAGTVASGGELGTYAVYPYSVSHKFTSATALTYNLPATYIYNKVESKIFSKTADDKTTYPENSTNIPLVGKITDGNIAFKHIGGLAVIRIDKMPAASGTLTVTADQQLSGDFTIADLSADDLQIVTASSSYNNKVTFTFSEATTTGAGVFYLPLATGDYTNVKITIAYGESNSTTQTIPYGSLSVARQSVTAIPLSTDSKGNLRYIVTNSDGSYTINGHKFVDLGLSVLWAETNIGAEKAEDYGNYYAWGEVTAFDEQTASGKKTNYSWSTYKWTNDNGSSFTKYTTDGKTVLDKEDDAAYVNWGSSCRMPTEAEIDELTNTANCNWVWLSDKKGSTVTSLKTDYTNNSIFLPASGFRDGEDYGSQGDSGYYWSSSLNPYLSYCAYDLYFNSCNQGSYGGYRYFGFAVRPVAEK